MLQRARPPSTAHRPLAEIDAHDDCHGVGLILNPDTLMVEGLLQGSSARESGMIEAGDVLTAVDGIPVRSYEIVKHKVLGQTGTNVHLSFAKTSADGKRVITLDLMRGPAPYISLAREAAHLEEENNRLKQQLAAMMANSQREPPLPAPVPDEDAMIRSLRSQLQNCMTQLQYKNDHIASLEEQLDNGQHGRQNPRQSQDRDSSPLRRSLDDMAQEMEDGVKQLMRSRDHGYSGNFAFMAECVARICFAAVRSVLAMV